jgi:hypothetical protein
MGGRANPLRDAAAIVTSGEGVLTSALVRGAA